jgi:hypothetical protein
MCVCLILEPSSSNNNFTILSHHFLSRNSNQPINPKTAGLGVFAGMSYLQGQLLGRVGDPAFATVDQDWHNSPAGGIDNDYSKSSSNSSSITKTDGDYHWPLTNYDWMAEQIGLEHEAEVVSATVTGFGAAPNCHFSLLNVEEHEATYIDNPDINRYNSPGAGASTPWYNRSSTAMKDIAAGQELFVDYGTNWFTSREGAFQLVPIPQDYSLAQEFLLQYGILLVGSTNPADLIGDKMSLNDEAQADLWDIITNTFPYISRVKQALPRNYKDAVRAIHGNIQTIEEENSIRSIQSLKEHGKCMDNIVPKKSTIPHAGYGAFATRFISKDSLIAPAPVVHIVDGKTTVNMYNDAIGRLGNIVRDETTGPVAKQLILNYCFGHANSSLLLFPYSSNVAYINHHATNYNAKVQWTTDFDFYHHTDWLNKSLEYLEEQWTSGLMLEFVALRDIQPDEEVLINYGDEWQRAWDEHVQHWQATSPEYDYNNLTHWTKPTPTNNGKDGYVRAEEVNSMVALRTMEEQIHNPYPHGLHIMCTVNVNHDTPYLYAPLLSIPYFKRNIVPAIDMPDDSDDRHVHHCNITGRYEVSDADKLENDDNDNDDHLDMGKYRYTIRVEVQKKVMDGVSISSSTNNNDDDDDDDDNGTNNITEIHEITNVPRSQITFVNSPYTSDVFLKNVFRHEMMLPDTIFPDAWKYENN